MKATGNLPVCILITKYHLGWSLLTCTLKVKFRPNYVVSGQGRGVNKTKKPVCVEQKKNCRVTAEKENIQIKKYKNKCF